MKKMVIYLHFYIFVFFSLNTASGTGNSILTYQDTSGHYIPIPVLSPSTPSRSPSVTDLKGSDNQWHKVTAAILTCGLDSDGHLIACPPSTVPVSLAKESNVASGITGLYAVGNLKGSLLVQQNISGIGNLKLGLAPALPVGFPADSWKDDIAVHAAAANMSLNVPIGNIPVKNLIVGGHRILDSVFSKFNAAPFGVGDNGGCVLSVVMTWGPTGAANCGAGGWDAVTEYELATNNQPYYITGGGFADENKVQHSVTFTVNGAYIRPALPASASLFLFQNMHIMTNIVAGPTLYTGESLDGVNVHRNQDQQFYGGMMTSPPNNGTDEKGSYTHITIDKQWQPISGKPVDKDHIPAVGSINTVSSGQIDSLDQVIYRSYSSPMILFGTYIKHFTRNTSCDVTVVSNADAGTNAKSLGPSRKCDEELDNWYSGPDYAATMHGLTIGGGFANHVSDDSYGLAIAGPWPTGIRTWLASTGFDFDGDAFKLGSRAGAPATVGAQKVIAEWWQEPSINVGYLESLKIWSQTDGISQQHNNYTNAPAATGQDISYWLGPRQSASNRKVDGTFETAVVFNPSWAKNGAAICGSEAAGFFGQPSKGTACLTVDTWGNATTSGTLTANNGAVVNGPLEISRGITAGWDSKFSGAIFHGDVHIINGKSLTFEGTDKKISYIYKKPGNITTLTSNSDNPQFFQANAFIGSLMTPLSSSSPCTVGQFEDDEHYHYVCVSPNKWRRIALSDF
ncbi:hypothetical protein [Gluconobacter cerinus]|uniref:hypothetical protein n=1 Tax=Gluconobacter cerinus TaxID=38307 RepID=UPI001B8CDA31|nr:hypothetical protein [Gluconobacter cerinus]MBS1045671.1 hypothetical protein [Gluconobacter cerinus]